MITTNIKNYSHSLIFKEIGAIQESLYELARVTRNTQLVVVFFLAISLLSVKISAHSIAKSVDFRSQG